MKRIFRVRGNYQMEQGGKWYSDRDRVYDAESAKQACDMFIDEIESCFGAFKVSVEEVEDHGSADEKLTPALAKKGFTKADMDDPACNPSFHERVRDACDEIHAKAFEEEVAKSDAAMKYLDELMATIDPDGEDEDWTEYEDYHGNL